MHLAVTGHAEKHNVIVSPLAPQPLVQSVTSGVFSASCCALHWTRFIEVVKFQPRLTFVAAMFASPAIHVQGILAKLSTMKATVIPALSVVLPRFFKMKFAQMAVTRCLIFAVAACAILSSLVVREEGLL